MDRRVCPITGRAEPLGVAVFFTHEPLVLAGTGQPLVVEHLRYLDLTDPPRGELEDAADDRRGGGVDDKMVVVLRVLEIPVGRECADELAAFLLDGKRAADLAGNVLGILRVEDILEGQEHIVGSLLAVHGVVDGNEPHTECREHTLKIVPHIDVVTAEAGKILDDNAIDFSCFKVGKHSLEGWAVKICAGITVICIMLGNVQFAA